MEVLRGMSGGRRGGGRGGMREVCMIDRIWFWRLVGFWFLF